MDRARDFHANVRYRYSVNGVAYEAERIRFGTVVGGRDFAQAIVARYPPGKSITVFFDGARPSEARLERSSFGLLTGAYMGIVIGGLAILILGVIGFFFLWHWIEGLWKRDRASAE